MRRLFSVAAALLLVLVLAGCRLDIHVDVTMTPDGSGTVSVAATADPELVTKAPSALADLRLDDARAAGWTVDGPTKQPNGSVKVTLTKPFHSPDEATAILAELNGPAGPLHNLTVTSERSFARVRSSMTGSAALTGGIAAFADAGLVQALSGRTPLADVVKTPIDQALGLTVTAHLPGTVVSTDGAASADRTSVSWTPSLADGHTTPMTVRFEQADRGALSARNRSHLAWAGLVAYALLFLAVVAAVIWWIRRHATQ